MMQELPLGEDDLQAWIDGRLDPRRQALVDRYLATHPETAERLAAQAAHRRALREALGPIASEPVPSRLRIASLVEARRRRRQSWRFAAAATVLLGLGFAGGWGLHGLGAYPGTSPQAGIASLSQEAADSYRVYASDMVQPTEMGPGHEAAMTAWLSQRLGNSVHVPDLAQAGYRFMGGRLVATPHGAAAFFLYDGDKGSRIAVLVRPMEVDRDARMSERVDRGLGGVSWATRGMGYSLVGADAPGELHPLADEVRRQMQRDG